MRCLLIAFLFITTIAKSQTVGDSVIITTSSGTDLPASITMASITASTIPSWVGAY